MKKCLAGCCLLMSLCVASSCTTKNNQRTDKVETTEESAFSGVHIVPEYARGFVLSYRSGYVLLDIQDPQNEESTTFHYALVRRGTKPSGIPGSYTVIETPIRSVVCMTSLQLSNFIKMGELDKVVGVTSTRHLFNKMCIRDSLRPVRWFRGVVTPVKEPEKVDMYIFRENTEDIYAGIEWQQGTSEARKFLKFLTEEMGVTKVRFPETSSFGVKPVSVEGTERLVRAAIEFALANRLPSVTLVHKGNIMKFTEGGFKLWGYALAEREFPDKTFTWPQYEKIKKEKGEDAAATALLDAEAAGKVVIKDRCV